MNNPRIGILGARSLIGSELIHLLKSHKVETYAFSRIEVDLQIKDSEAGANVHWKLLNQSANENADVVIESWISLIPIWNLKDYKHVLKAHGAKKIIAFSSTSLFTKKISKDPKEQLTSNLYQAGENDLQEISRELGIRWTIFRPTLIYGRFDDRNISEIKKFIERFRFFPIFGEAVGKRQPIHVKDVAEACLTALRSENVGGKVYTISGAEVLTYRELVNRVFRMLGYPTWTVKVPLMLFRIAISLIKVIPKFKKWSPSMAERMNVDLVFDQSDATRDFGFTPRSFELDPKDYVS